MRARYAFVALAALTLVMAAVAMLFTVSYYHREQAAQQFATLDRLASRKPPAGSPSDLSRAYLLWQWSQLAELGPDVGCGR
jgi:hypothetical protein